MTSANGRREPARLAHWTWRFLEIPKSNRTPLAGASREIRPATAGQGKPFQRRNSGAGRGRQDAVPASDLADVTEQLLALLAALRVGLLSGLVGDLGPVVAYFLGVEAALSQEHA